MLPRQAQHILSKGEGGQPHTVSHKRLIKAVGASLSTVENTKARLVVGEDHWPGESVPKSYRGVG